MEEAPPPLSVAQKISSPFKIEIVPAPPFYNLFEIDHVGGVWLPWKQFGYVRHDSGINISVRLEVEMAKT